MTTTTWHTSWTRSGHFGPYGGRYVPFDALMVAPNELTAAFTEALDDLTFRTELESPVADGRRAADGALTFAENLTRKLGGAKIYLKREARRTRAHKINNAIAQGLLAKRKGKKKDPRRDRR